MTEDNPKDKSQNNERHGESNPEFENFQEILKRSLSVPKEELDKRLAEEKREKKEKRAG